MSSHLMASDCENINLYEQASLNRKIYNQGDMHTCYAHSLSALYEQEYKERVNPYWIAFIHKDRLLHWQPNNLNFSLLSWAYSDLVKKGRCSNKIISDNLKRLKAQSLYSDDQFFYLIQIYFKKEKNLAKLLDYLKENSKDFERAWKLDDIKNILGLVQRAESTKLFDFLKDEVFKGCEYTDDVNANLVSMGRGFESNKKLLNTINNVLKDHKALSIGLCPSAAYKYTEDDIKTKPRLLKSVKGRCGAHYVNIVGSRERENKCELLIRNSYPGFWAHKSLECYCQDGVETFNCTKADITASTKVLGCWVPSEKVLSNTYDLSYFE